METTTKRPAMLLQLAVGLAVWFSLGAAAGQAVQPPDGDVLTRRYDAQSLRVSIWLDKDSDQVYRRGEPLEVAFQTNEDAYVVLYHIDVQGRVDILWPTSRFNDGFVFGGHQYRLPASDAKRLRVGDDEGLGYMQAVVSRYPFDLRDLPLDFHHEVSDRRYDVHVAGDPYQAMNEVNFEVTGLEDPSEFVITNHVSYYVHRQVEHPRYLCFQCHDDGLAQEPYRNTCTVTIQHDHSWQNQWWGQYGFYPAYHYPVYVYIDPWTSYRWVNYWYDPWYYWPPRSYHSWGYTYYDWRYSPHWTWNSHIAYQSGERRYAPLTKPAVERDRDLVSTRTKNAMVTDERPAADRLRDMKNRTVADADRRRDDRVRVQRDGPGGGASSNVQPVARPQERFETDQRIRTTPGLRLDDRTGGASGSREATRTGEPTVRDPRGAADRGQREAIRQPDRTTDERPQVRPVEPRRDGGRVWTNRRNTTQPDDPRPTPPVARPGDRRQDDRSVAPVEPRREDAGRSVQRPAQPPKVSPPPPQRPAQPPASPPQRVAPAKPQNPSPPPPPPSSGSRGDGGRSSRGNQGGSDGGKSTGGRR